MPRKAKTAPPDTITAYKAFNADWTCRGYQYEVGKTYEHPGPVEMCATGFHACTVPFDCWSYYERSTALARVTLASVTDERQGDSKVCGARITIEARLDLSDWTKAQVETVTALCKTAAGRLADSGHAAATGYRGHAAATGYRGHAAATGENAIAASLGIVGTARAAKGNWLVLAAYDDDFDLICVKSVQVDGETIKADTAYRLTADGELVEAEG
ncbi:hypothetical protein ACFOGJ_16085 [Marinibaculum pumilum]|uniref:DUF7666 domain-containing protein n=1 Tax=Marinibaculum pumilum TaxID=1766165 RepID=A0ABV7L2P8_9PROT